MCYGLSSPDFGYLLICQWLLCFKGCIILDILRDNGFKGLPAPVARQLEHISTKQPANIVSSESKVSRQAYGACSVLAVHRIAYVLSPTQKHMSSRLLICDMLYVEK